MRSGHSSKRLARCDQHGLHYDAAVHEGCPLCREDRSPAPRPLKWIVVGALGLTAVAALAWKLASPPDDGEEEPSASTEAVEDELPTEAPVGTVPLVGAGSPTPPPAPTTNDAAAPAEIATAADDGEGALEAAAVEDSNAKACLRGDAGACVRAAHVHRFGQRGADRNPALARQLYDRGCDDGDPGSCLQLGFMERNGEGGEKNEAASYQLFRRAATLAETDCNNDDKRACLLLADAYRNGRGIPKDVEKAESLLDKVMPGWRELQEQAKGDGG